MCGAVVLAGIGLASAAWAAPKTAQFQVSAVHSGPGVSVTIKSTCWVTDTAARADVEHPLEGKQRTLLTGGWVYMLNPERKQGIKNELPPEMKSRAGSFDFLLSQIAFDARKAIQKAKKVGTETVSGYLCDVYSDTEIKGDETRSIKVWVPQKMDPRFPVKGMMSQKLKKTGATAERGITITLHNIRLQKPIPKSVFAIPSGYDIRDAKDLEKQGGAAGGKGAPPR